MALFCLIVGLLLVAWGIWKGPFFNASCREAYPDKVSLFFGTAVAAAFGLFGVLLSVLFLTGVLPFGR